jgi:hypothetical protein
MYYTKEIFESGGSPVQGWVLMDTQQPCDAPVFYCKDAYIVTTTNGLSDLAPFFDLHDNLDGCVCTQCGKTYHNLVGGECTRCEYIDK